jgi:hypothetical protein
MSSWQDIDGLIRIGRFQDFIPRARYLDDIHLALSSTSFAVKRLPMPSPDMKMWKSAKASINNALFSLSMHGELIAMGICRGHRLMCYKSQTFV